MDFAKDIKKAMIDNNIEGAIELSKIACVSYGKANRALRGDTSLRMCDVREIGKAVGLDLVFVTIGKGRVKHLTV